MSATSASSILLFRSLATCCGLVIVGGLVPPPSRTLAADPASPSVVESSPAVEGCGMWRPATVAPHLVLRPHRQPSFAKPAPRHRPGTGMGPGRHHSRGSHDRAEHVSGNRAAVPEAATIYRKKIPYSYGYFGARQHRHWSSQHGHRQDRIEWVLR